MRKPLKPKLVMAFLFCFNEFSVKKGGGKKKKGEKKRRPVYILTSRTSFAFGLKCDCQAQALN